MNNIDWESLKKAVADNEEKEKENNTSVVYIIELNGEPVEVEIKKSNAPQNKEIDKNKSNDIACIL